MVYECPNKDVRTPQKTWFLWLGEVLAWLGWCLEPVFIDFGPIGRRLGVPIHYPDAAQWTKYQQQRKLRACLNNPRAQQDRRNNCQFVY